jgi:hypothetical protein
VIAHHPGIRRRGVEHCEGLFENGGIGLGEPNFLGDTDKLEKGG